MDISLGLTNFNGKGGVRAGDGEILARVSKAALLEAARNLNPT